MKHYVLTRSAYDPKAWSIEANRRRLVVTRAVTVPSMAAQQADFTWLILIDPEDPMRDQRIEAFRSSGKPVIPIVWRYQGEPEHARWDRRTRARSRLVERMAAMAYRAPWRDYMEGGRRILQTRLDDDDALAPDAMVRYQRAAASVNRRQILMLSEGVRVYRGRYNDVTHDRNAMHTLVTLDGDPLCVYDYGHAVCHRTVPVRIVDRETGWLWVRHQDTISGWKRDHPYVISDALRGRFPIDWPALEASWR
jgi:hypothetical protein